MGSNRKRIISIITIIFTINIINFMVQLKPLT